MSHLLGTDAVDRFTLLDSEGVAIEGETFTIDAAYGPTAVTETVTELGNGMYQLTVPISASGAYYLRLVGDTSGQIHEFSLLTDEAEVGDTLTDYFTILDADGALVVGATLTVDAAYDPGGASFAPTLLEIGNGLYSATWGADSAGVYTLRVLATLPDPDEPQIFEFEHVVLAIVAEVSPLTAPIGTTLDDIIRGVAMACRDYYEVEATTDAPDGTSFPDADNLSGKPAKTFKGADLFVLEAADTVNVGRHVRTIDSVDGALLFARPLPGVIRTGDVAYLTDLESTGNSRRQYRTEINSRIKSSFPFALRDAAWTFTAVFDACAPYLTPPEEFTHISLVSFPLYSDAAPTVIPFAEYADGDGWTWDAAHDRLQINTPYRDAAHNAYLTIRGYGRWPDLVEGTDITGVDYEWLVHATAGMLVLATRDPRRQSEAAMHFNRADALRIKASTSIMPNTVMVRP